MFLPVIPVISGVFTFVAAHILANKVADVITSAITGDDPEWRENDADFDKAVLHSTTSVAAYAVTSGVLNAALGAHPVITVAGTMLHATYAIARAADHARSFDLGLGEEASLPTTYAQPQSTTGGGGAATSAAEEPAQPTMQPQESATVGGGGAQQAPGCSSVSGGCGSSNGGGQGGPVPTCLEQPSCIWATPVTWHALY